MEQEPSESRTLMISDGTAVNLARIGSGFLDDWPDRERVFGELPKGLTPEELQHLGSRVVSLVETIAPSRDVVSRGLKNERTVMSELVWYSIRHEDSITAENAIKHLKSSTPKGGVKGRVEVYFLQRAFKKYKSSHEEPEDSPV